jgi:predicted PhzF superfamily epimerase YddE/YHI9
LDEGTVLRIARFLQVPREAIVAHQHCANGPCWKAVMLRSADEVLALKPRLSSETDMEIGVVAPHAAGTQLAFEVRAFFPAPGDTLAEDPVTGSLNAALAQWLIGEGLAPASYVAAQGTALGRAGRVFVQQDGADIWIGGASVTVVEGQVTL